MRRSQNKLRRGRKRQKHKVQRFKPPGKLKSFLSKNTISITAILISVLTSLTVYYFSYAQPDLRLSANTSSGKMIEVLDATTDEHLNAIAHVRFRAKFTNVASKSGYIDKVEFVPITLANIPEIKITHVDKELIGWGEEKEIEILFLVTIPRGVSS